ncbi:helix-turn-helix domain-containing protein [Bacillus benzoevorans]|uniref:Transcriptional regulator with XRE-family HTH domain n=1 Tax=Bacillus benzoevorans TaxID=1456 RepID=A0A7X0HWF2_9BACI|nr:helix-turn-helix transcriptional regulator [Bacillus benzoevorans]MBB6447991.1 transcriptional regulator with XRE-family HTH domain [Bacillus benzoevorans]
MLDFEEMKLGRFFEDLRRMHRKSQDDLQTDANLDRRTISNLENDKTKPSFETLVKLACAYDMLPSELFLEMEKRTNLLECLKKNNTESE